jgi:hypothetical protein
MAFQRQLLATVVGSSLHMSSGNFVRLMQLVTSCHYRITPIKWMGQTLHRHLQAWPPQTERGEDVDKTLDTFLLAYRMTPKSNLPNSIVLLNYSLDLSPGCHWISFFRPCNQLGMTYKWSANSTASMEWLCVTLMWETLSMYDTNNLMNGRQHQSLNESVAVSMM